MGPRYPLWPADSYGGIEDALGGEELQGRIRIVDNNPTKNRILPRRARCPGHKFACNIFNPLHEVQVDARFLVDRGSQLYEGSNWVSGLGVRVSGCIFFAEGDIDGAVAEDGGDQLVAKTWVNGFGKDGRRVWSAGGWRGANCLAEFIDYGEFCDNFGVCRVSLVQNSMLKSRCLLGDLPN